MSASNNQIVNGFKFEIKVKNGESNEKLNQNLCGRKKSSLLLFVSDVFNYFKRISFASLVFGYIRSCWAEPHESTRVS